jgi:hypothetical protein
MYAYAAAFIYVILKTTTAINEQSYLLVRPLPPGACGAAAAATAVWVHGEEARWSAPSHCHPSPDCRGESWHVTAVGPARHRPCPYPRAPLPAGAKPGARASAIPNVVGKPDSVPAAFRLPRRPRAALLALQDAADEAGVAVAALDASALFSR